MQCQEKVAQKMQKLCIYFKKYVTIALKV